MRPVLALRVKGENPAQLAAARMAPRQRRVESDLHRRQSLLPEVAAQIAANPVPDRGTLARRRAQSQTRFAR